MTSRLLRKLTAEELADLPSTWENSKVDTNKYYMNIMDAYEIDQGAYTVLKNLGDPVQEYEGRYYVGV